MSLSFLLAHRRCDRCGNLIPVRTLSSVTGESLCVSCRGRQGDGVAAPRAQGVPVTRRASAGLLPAGFARVDRRMPHAAAPRPMLERRKPLRVSAADVRAALWRLRAQRALQRIAPSALSPERSPRQTG